MISGGGAVTVFFRYFASLAYALALCGATNGAVEATRGGVSSEEAGPARFRIASEELVAQPISPLIYGNFIESGFGRQVDGMWAELLANRSFEEVTPLKESVWDWLARRPGDDLSREPWWHSGYEEHPWYLAPGNAEARLEHPRYWDFHHGLQSASVANRSTAQPARLAQDGIYVRRGVSSRFSGFLRAGDVVARDDAPVAVSIGLYREKDFAAPLVESRIEGVRSAWHHFSAQLANGEFEGRASFAIAVPPGASVVMDGLSLVPEDNVRGWRKEVVEALKRVRPPIIRFPGGCFASFYDWRDGIGPRANRCPRESEYWGGLENNDVGTAEFVTLCRMIGAEPFLCVNVMTGTAAQAADWVAYANAPPAHPLGALRERHGYAEPFAVTYWELDNETYRKYGPIEYAERCVTFARTMKAVDPKIRLVMVGYWRFRDFLPAMLEIAGPAIDLVTDRGLDEAYLRGVLEDLRAYNKKSGRQIRLCNTEWLAPSDDVPVVPDALNRQPSASELTLQNRQIRWRYAMNAARQLLVFQRLGGEFAFANFNNLANTWGQNVIECPKEGAYLSATGRVFELLSVSPAAWPLRIEGAAENPGIPVGAAWDRERKALVITALNYRGREVELAFDLALPNFKPKAADISILRAPSPASYNTLADPNAIARSDRRQETAAPDRFVVTAPPYAVIHAVLR
jgi:alpha-L-arabinofuranosidase